MKPTIHVFIGTKAQYIKTAPLLRLMDRRCVDYRLIDSGQHGALSRTLRAELGVRGPDLSLGEGRDIDSIRQALWWTVQTGRRLRSRKWLRSHLFGGADGICVLHGDTQSTLLALLMAKRAGLRVAHLEAGLRSNSLFHPFPEELIRLIVMRASDRLFAPDELAVRNLERMGLGGRVTALSANTSVEALRYSLSNSPSPADPGVVMTMHRLENLKRPQRVRAFVGLAQRIAATWPVSLILHGHTREVLARRGDLERLRAAAVNLLPLQSHGEFTGRLNAAPFVVTDGGSVQEECALLGVPTLLWRKATERPDGLGSNVVLSGYEPQRIDAFLTDPEVYRRAPVTPDVAPSEEVLETLLQDLSGDPLRTTPSTA